MSSQTTMAEAAQLAKTYQHQTDIEHVLSSPDTYTGSMSAAEWETYVLNGTTSDPVIERETIVTVPGLFKLFDEGLVNCRDHQVRMAQAVVDGKSGATPVTKIEVSLGEDGTITMLNDGNGIDIAPPCIWGSHQSECFLAEWARELGVSRASAIRLQRRSWV